MDQQQQKRSAQQAPRPQQGPAGPALAPDSSAETSGGGLRGWLSGAAGWISEKAGAAGQAIGDFVDDSRRVLGDTWEAVRETDVDWSRDAVRVETDLDEVLDVLPASLRDQLDLDRQGAANRASLTLNRKDGSLRIDTADLRLRSLQAGGLQTGAVSLQGVQIDLRNPDGGLPFLDSGFRIPGLYQDKTDNLDVEVRVAQVEASDVQLAGVGTARRVALSGLHAQAATQGGAPFQSQGPTLASFSVAEGVVSGLTVGDMRAEQLRLGDAKGVLDEASGTTALQAASLGVSGGQQGDRRLGDASATGVQANLSDKARSLQVETASLRDFSDPSLGRVGGATLSDLSLSHSEDALRAQLGSLDAGAVAFQSGGLEASANQVSARKLQAEAGRDGGLKVQAGRLGAEAARFRMESSDTQTTTKRPAVDEAALQRSLLARVDSADIAGSARLQPGVREVGDSSLTFKEDTTLSGRLRVDKNRITPGQTAVQLSRAAEGPLWTSLNGAYVDEKGRLMADVRGWFDKDVTESTNQGLGVKGDRLASLATYGEALARQPRPSGSGGKQAGDLDPSSVDVAGRVGLSAGRIDAGRAGAATLDAPADVSFRASAGEAMVASFAKLLVSALRVDLGDQKAAAGGARLTGGSVTAGPDAVSGVVQTIRLDEVDYTRPGSTKK